MSEDNVGAASAEEQTQAEIDGLLVEKANAHQKGDKDTEKAVDASLKRRGYKAEHATAPADADAEQATVDAEVAAKE